MENYFKRFVNNLDAPFDDVTVGPQNDGGLIAEPYPLINNRDKMGSEKDIYDDVGQILAAKLAIYDSPMAAPRVIDLNAADYDECINLLATKTYQSSKEIGGNMPYTIIREIIENLIHARFVEVVISIFDNGNTVRISDQGPGIRNKEKAVEPGFSTATKEMKQHIKGVGSGLPITKETLLILGGAIMIEDNLDSGSVITLKVPFKEKPIKREDNLLSDTPKFDLNKRQRQVLFLIMELGTVGPSKIANELGISLSTAYRDLIYLEEQSLIYSDEQGKRVLTPIGIEYLDEILNS